MTTIALSDNNLEVFSLISRYIQNNKNLSEQDKNMIINKLLTSISSPSVNIYDLHMNNPNLSNSIVLSTSLHNQTMLNDVSIEDMIRLYKKRHIKFKHELNIKPTSYIKSLPITDFPYKNQSSFINSISKKEYFHLKTILGHLSLQDDMLGPIPIYCVVSIQKLDMFVTGDSNG